MVRIVLGGPGPGPEALARALRDAGHEVVLAGGYDEAGLAAVVLQEDADLVVTLGGPLDGLLVALADRDVTDVPMVVADPADLAGTLRRVAAYDG
ncbi:MULTISPECIES: hypothetical protein [unclassified Nocardioides]|uniref:hypothetical protein n=1 Tax=unclassified Nocardioides TaxID=2615069 RepID=UPI0030153711